MFSILQLCWEEPKNFLIFVFNGTSPLVNSIVLCAANQRKALMSNKERSNIKLSDIQKEILIGTILGDAYIERKKLTHNARIRYDQTFPKHSSYLMNIYSWLYNLTGKGPSLIIRKPDKRTGKIYYQIQFKTLNLPCLNFYHDLFYKEGKKIIPETLGELLTPRALAYWIMDDGGKSTSNQTILHTRAHSLNDVLLVQKVLKHNFKLKI